VEPVSRKDCNLFESSGLLKKVRGAGNELELCWRAKKLHGFTVHPYNGDVVRTYNEQGRCLDAGQGRTSQVGSATPRNYCAHEVRAFGCRDQRRNNLSAKPAFQDSRQASPKRRSAARPIG
jgi:hypothetical protein